MAHYRFGDVLRYTDLPPNRLKRWVQAGIITPEGTGSPAAGWSRFPFRSLIAAVVCDDLRILGVGEPGMRKIVEALHVYWDQPDEPLRAADPNGPKLRDAPIVWVAAQRHIVDSPEYGSMLMEGANCYLVTQQDLFSRLTDGAADGSGVAETGIAIPIARIISDLESKTGDIFDFQATLRKKVAEAMRAAFAKDQDHE